MKKSNHFRVRQNVPYTDRTYRKFYPRVPETSRNQLCRLVPRDKYAKRKSTHFEICSENLS